MKLTQRINNEAEKKIYVANWQKSGLTRTAFCEQHGLNRKNFGHWVRQYTSSSTQTTQAIKMLPIAVSDTLSDNQQIPIEICLPSQENLLIKLNISIADLIILLRGL